MTQHLQAHGHLARIIPSRCAGYRFSRSIGSL